MDSLTYLPSKDREELIFLQEERQKCIDPALLNRIDKKIREISLKIKPLHECNLEECSDLKSQLNRKLERAKLFNKGSLTRSFMRMIQTVSARSNAIMLQMHNDANVKQQDVVNESRMKKLYELVGSKEQKDELRKRENANSTNSTGIPKSKNSWSIDIGDYD